MLLWKISLSPWSLLSSVMRCYQINGVTSQKLLILIETAVTTSNLIMSPCVCVMQSQPPGRKDKQRAVSVQWSCNLECCTGDHTEHDLQWRHKPAATSLFTKLWLWGSLEVCWSFHKGNCNCMWRLLCCTMWWCAVWQLVVNICSCYLLRECSCPAQHG